MSVQRQSIPPTDTETTAELPVLDVATYEAAMATTEERAGSTDTWHLPSLNQAALQAAAVVSQSAAVAAAQDRSLQLETDLRALSENLRDVEERLTRKGERLIELERDLANSRAERLAVDERAASLVSEANARAAAALAEAEAARTDLNGERERARSLQAEIEQRDLAARSLQLTDQQRMSELASRERELVTARADLSALEARASLYLESLQSLEGRRNIFDGQLLGLDHEVLARDAQLKELRQELTAQTTRASGLEKELAARQKRVESLEREVASLASSLGARNVEAEQSGRTNSKLQDTVSSLTETLAARVERIKALESAVASQNETLAERGKHIETLTTERESLNTEIANLETSLATAEHDIKTRDAAIAEAARAHAALEKAHEVSQARIDELDRDLAVLRAESAERAASVLRLEAERDGQLKRFTAAEARAVELEQRVEDGAEMLKQLQEELRAAVSRSTDLEGDLHAAEDAIHRLETELRAKTSKLDDLTRTHEEWRTTIDSARQSLAERDSLINRLETEAANSAALLGNIQQSMKRFDTSQSGSHEIAPEGAVRLLIRVDGDSEVVHVLGRKTTVGRTPDNDLQIDAKFISRNHAVILAGPNHTIIEDLNSTNGIAVNGKRVTRHTLRDGDNVAIGKTTFRFAVRQTQDRRN
jgi:chromosome segregation ATPase